MSIKKKSITRAIKQATMSIIFSACACVACRFQSMQTIIFNYKCDSVSSTAVKFQNHAAVFQHSLPILITDSTYICSILLCLKPFMVTRYTSCFKEHIIFTCFCSWPWFFPHLNKIDYFCSKLCCFNLNFVFMLLQWCTNLQTFTCTNHLFFSDSRIMTMRLCQSCTWLVNVSP